MSVISYFLAFLAGLVNATSNVLNRKAARDEPDQAEFRLKLITDLMHRKIWLAAVGLMIISFALAAAALGTGQLASVQLVVVLELPMTIIGGAWLLHTPLGPREWTAIAALTAGVIGLLALLDPRPGPAKPIAPILWITMSAANVGAVAALYLAARAHKKPAVRASLLGIACGLGYGLTAAFTKGMADAFNAGGIVAVFTTWQFYGCISAGVTAAFLLENAYQAGPLTASQPGITLIDPLVSMIWGIVIFGETVNHGTRLALTALPALAVAAGVSAYNHARETHYVNCNSNCENDQMRGMRSAAAACNPVKQFPAKNRAQPNQEPSAINGRLSILTSSSCKISEISDDNDYPYAVDDRQSNRQSHSDTHFRAAAATTAPRSSRQRAVPVS